MVLVAIECGLESILQEERGELSMGWRKEKRSQGSESQNVSEEEVFKRDYSGSTLCDQHSQFAVIEPYWAVFMRKLFLLLLETNTGWH